MDNKKKNIDELIRKQLENYTQSPSSRVWENIMAAGIDTSAPISTKNNNRKYWIYAFTGAAMLTLIALVFSPKDPIAKVYNQIAISNNNFQNNKAKASEPPLAFEEKILNSGNSSFNFSAINQSNPTSLIVLTPKSEFKHRQDKPDMSAMRNHQNLINTYSTDDNTFQNSNTSENAVLTEINQKVSEDESVFDQQLTRIEPITNDFDKALTGIYLGVSGGYNYTTIVENNPVGYDNTPIISKGKYGPTKGITIGYNFNQSFGIQLDYNYNSIEGTNYTLESDPNGKKSLQLIYDQFPVTFKYRIPQMNYLNNRLKILNVYAGIQYNKLKEYHLPQEQRYDYIADPINKNTISFVAGFNYDINVLPSLYLSLGARGLISSNIANSTYPISDNQSHSFSLGARAGIFYQFNTH